METKNQTPQHASDNLSGHGGQLASFLASRAFFSLQSDNKPLTEEDSAFSQPLCADRDRTFVGNRLFLLA
jgi:hypothetical protein